jgi:hypothetical protein
MNGEEKKSLFESLNVTDRDVHLFHHEKLPVFLEKSLLLVALFRVKCLLLPLRRLQWYARYKLRMVCGGFFTEVNFHKSFLHAAT